ncbi:SH3-domain kinase binding protein 1 [Podila minutissima]|uniref:SH3-domain kinase binding protein 1 n=1 Tax=Podila minutissima TaxID=64525 RepID=A0A9P5STF0_9FUNG|nr:SH3-domain kinase binding protein 1 [Podila minutissima]
MLAATTTTYVAHHQYDAEKEDELSLDVGDVITVSDMSDPGWWVGEKVKDGKAGWFPSNFVDPYEEPAQAEPAAVAAPPAPAPAPPHPEAAEAAHPAIPDSAPPPVPKHEGPIFARVEYDYEAKESGELSLEVGRVVTVLDKSGAAWWTGDLNGKVGAFPSNYVKLIENKEEGDSDKPAKFKLAAFGVKQGGLGSLFAGGVIPGLKKTGGLKKIGVDTGAPAPAPPAQGTTSKRTSVDEPRSPVVHAAAPKLTAPIADEVVAPLIAPTAVHAPPVPVEEVAASPEPRIPSRAKKPKAKQIKALVIYDYSAQEDDEISLAKGSTVIVTDKMGDEGWWCGRNEQGKVGNFPSDFVQEIKEEVQSPVVAPAPIPVQAQVPVQEPAPKSPEPERRPLPAPAPVAPVPVVPAAVPEPVHAEPLRSDLPRTRTNDGAPLATPPAFPRTSRPPSMITSPTQPSADFRALNEGPPLPASPPPKRMSMASRSNSQDTPSSPRPVSVVLPGAVPIIPSEVASPTSTTAPLSGDLSRSSTLRRPHKSVPEAPLEEVDEDKPITAEAVDHEEPVVRSNRSSCILPSPVARSRPLPPLARPPSVHSITENRKSVVLPHLPPVPSEIEEPTVTHVQEDVVEEEPEQVEESIHVEHPSAVEHPAAVEHETIEEVVPEVVAPVVEEQHKEVEQEEVPEPVATEEEEVVPEEKEPEKPKLPEIESSGPALSHASRPRPAKGRKPPSAPVPNAEASFASQLEAEVKAAPIIEEKKPEPAPAPVSAERAAPPPKPMKPIFSKFPTPFAGAQPASIALRPTGRRVGQDGPLSPGAEPSSHSSAVAIGSTASAGPGAVSTPPTGGVKSLSSRFGQFQGVPASGGNNAALELELAKLKRWMNEELDKVKKDLSDEREHRQKLEQEVQELKAQLQG